MKVLNLYAGLGGNRKLWQNVEVTAVEISEHLTEVYNQHFPDDTVIVGDAHAYLLDHYKEFDFIWSSPPCPTHSNARYWGSKGGNCELKYPDMNLYQEIIFLKHYALKGQKWVVENVKPYYTPLIRGQELGRHIFWTNFRLTHFEYTSNYVHNGKDMERVRKFIDFDLSQYKGGDKCKVIRNCVHPELGLHIFNRAYNIIQEQNINQTTLF